jgi:hypothetical protein
MNHKELSEAFCETTAELVHLLVPLSEEQLNKIPFEGSWTAGQLGHHLLRSYGIAEVLNGRTVVTERPVDEKIKPVKEVFLNFDIKMKTPDFIIPSTGWIEREKLLRGLEDKIKFISDFIDNDHDLTFTCLDFELPGAGALTRSEWIQFMTVHTQRHVHQLKNILKNLPSV